MSLLLEMGADPNMKDNNVFLEYMEKLLIVLLS